jgi:parvulin-like peptidyl-prolyl isomerase
MRYRSLIAFVAACAALTACEGLKEALTAHVDVVAQAGPQQLSVTRLSDLVGHTKLQNVPANRDVANIVADLWVDYQLMGEAAAKGDSLNNTKAIDDAIVTVTSKMRLAKVQDTLDKLRPKPAASEAGYNQATGNLFAARHILFMFPQMPQGVPLAQTVKDSVRKKAEGVLAQVTDKNFAELAKKYSQDGSAAQGGDLGVFPRGIMVKSFGDALASLKPGEISKIVETQFGYHIVQRLTYAEAKAAYDRQFTQLLTQTADSEYKLKLDSEVRVQVKSTAPAMAKAAALAAAAHRKDHATLATFKGGDLTTARFIVWLEGMDPRSNVPRAMQTAPDSLISNFLKELALNEVMLKKADSMKIEVTAEEKKNLYHDFGQLVTAAWAGLNVDPKALADSGKSEPERRRVAAGRVDAFIDHLMAGESPQPVQIAPPLKVYIETQYSWKVNQAGLDRAAERARSLRSTDDSTRAANQPRSQVPMPGGPPATPPPGGTKAPPPPTKKP